MGIFDDFFSGIGGFTADSIPKVQRAAVDVYDFGESVVNKTGRFADTFLDVFEGLSSSWMWILLAILAIYIVPPLINKF